MRLIIQIFTLTLTDILRLLYIFVNINAKYTYNICRVFMDEGMGCKERLGMIDPVQ